VGVWKFERACARWGWIPGSSVLLLAALLLAGCPSSDACGDPSCAPVQRVVDDVNLRRAAKVAAAADGTTWLLWVESVPGGEAVVAARRGPRGELSRWTLSDQPLSGAVDHSLVIVDGTPIAVWWDVITSPQNHLPDPRHVRVASWDGGRWNPERSVPGTFGTILGATVQTQASAVHLVWVEIDGAGRARLQAMRRAPGGLWSAAQTVHDTAPGVSIAAWRAAASQTGGGLVVWRETRDGGDTPQGLWASRFDAQQQVWLAPQQIADGIQHFDLPVAAPWGAEGWLVAWLEGDQLRDIARVRAKRFASGAWESNAMPVASHTAGGYRELVLRAFGSRAVLAWRVDTATGHGVLVSHLDASAAGWSAPSVLSPPSTSQAAGFYMAHGVDGRLAIVWGAATGPTGPWLARTDPSGRWLPTESLEADPLNGGNGPHVALRPSGGWTVVWFRPQAALADVLLRDVP
jgi:hypothetical protein